MDAFSAAELSELWFQAQAAADTQFQYWLTITFAVVVAGFVAGERLSNKLRILAAALYLLATFLLMQRFGHMATGSGPYQQALIERGIDALPRQGLTIVITRVAVFLLGTASALYFLLRKDKTTSNKRS